MAVTGSAWQVLADARNAADTLSHHSVGSAHVLLGLLHRANGGRSILAQLGATPAAMRSSMLRTLREGPPARR